MECQSADKMAARVQANRTCKFCGRVFKAANARKGHETKMHRLEIAKEISLKGSLSKWQR